MMIVHMHDSVVCVRCTCVVLCYQSSIVGVVVVYVRGPVVGSAVGRGGRGGVWSGQAGRYGVCLGLGYRMDFKRLSC
jgi:hypothetical protein